MTQDDDTRDALREKYRRYWLSDDIELSDEELEECVEEHLAEERSGEKQREADLAWAQAESRAKAEGRDVLVVFGEDEARRNARLHPKE